jgi:hypothetical protein
VPAEPTEAAKPQGKRAEVKVNPAATNKQPEPKKENVAAAPITPGPTTPEQRQGVLKKFEGPKPPPKVNLQTKTDNKNNAPDNEASASKEAQK